MITEDYVSFETAKLLKEKGFTENEDCFCFYDKKGNIHLCQTFGDISDYDEDTCLDAPTLQMAMKWLREVHKIHVAVYPYGEYSCDNYQFDLYKDNNLVVSKDEGYITYEQACETAIKYCLENLI